MSILTKTSRRRTSFEGYSYLLRKVSMSNQLQSQCCKQNPSSDKRLHCTKSFKKGVVADFISYKEAGRHLANKTIKAQPYKSLSANDEGSLPFHTKGLLLAERIEQEVNTNHRCLSPIFVFTDLSHHRTCGSAYGGSYFGCHSRYEPISVG